MKRATRVLLALAGCCSVLTAATALGAQPAAPYVLPDGSIYIVGDRAAEPLLARWNDLYIREHPGTRFKMLLRDSPVGMDGIIAGVSLFAPLARDAWESDVDPFKRLYGHYPIDIRVARIGYSGPGRRNPAAIYVNAANPVARLGIAEAARIFTAGNPSGDLRRWNQLGVGGDWGKHAIHAYGTRDDGMTITTLRIARFGARPFASHYEALPDDADVLRALSADRYGIGLLGPVDSRDVPGDVKMLGLGGDPASTARYDDVRDGRYPLSPFLHFYVPLAPGQPFDPVAREYLRHVLSPEGQRIVEEAKDREGFVPLAPAEAASEMAKLR